ncbi:MAG: hypothetical protein CMA72_03710 [Euryarchaeota archaeon]|nr:hypothetical protein [Euryarchaeota archaeon]|tara:strand:- start:74 stop:922 length:849 start_codon:yes stop_codon:yes gene_type:complete
MSIASSGMLVRLHITTWTAEKLDKEQTERVLQDNNAERDAGKFKKNLMSGSKLVKELNNDVTKVRHWCDKQTMPWEHRGANYLPTSLFLEFKQGWNKRKSALEGQADDIAANYAALKETAKRTLGSMYREEEYPTAEEVRAKYSFKVYFTPVPESGHFAIDLAAEELEETKRSCDKLIEERVAEAHKLSWQKLYDKLKDMSERLVDEPDKKRRWHDAFVDDPVELCKLLKHFNVNQDPQLESARLALEDAMRGTDIDSIKDSPIVRANLKGKVDSILKTFDW